jgi:copper chaperone
MTEQRLDLGLTAAAAGCGDACGCAHGSASASSAPIASSTARVSEWDVAGMTCAHCERAVTDEVKGLPGVQDVSVSLVPGGTSRVTVRSADDLDPQAVRAAVAEAGYQLVD